MGEEAELLEDAKTCMERTGKLHNVQIKTT